MGFFSSPSDSEYSTGYEVKRELKLRESDSRTRKGKKVKKGEKIKNSETESGVGRRWKGIFILNAAGLPQLPKAAVSSSLKAEDLRTRTKLWGCVRNS